MAKIIEKCPNCGAEVELDDTQEIGECSYCASKFDIQAKSSDLQADDAVLHENKAVNEEFEAKLSNAENWAQIYFIRGPRAVKYKKGLSGTIKGFEAVINYYAEAELSGGANESRYYISLINFYLKANLQGFEKRTRILRDKFAFIDYYVLCMDNAIKYADESDKARLENEKQLTVNRLHLELDRYLPRRYT